MRRAILLGEKGRTSAAPNPWVGCVIVKDGSIIAEGFHAVKGREHAEVNALGRLKSPDEAEGASAYVTLEPCCHFGSTPPCVDALISAKIARVFVAIGADPDTKVNGGGVDILRHAGIEVFTGICEAEARESLRSYLHHRSSGRPYVVAKVGTSMNGKVAFSDGSSKWITSETAREESMRIRRESQAILVGIGTVLKDNPRLTLRGAAQENKCVLPFTRCVLDPNAKLATNEYKSLNLNCDNEGTVIVFTRVHPPPNSEQIEWIHMPDGISLGKVLEILGKRGILQLLVEGGPTTLSKFIDENLLNELTMFVAPFLIGAGGLSFFSGLNPVSISDPLKRFRLAHVKPVTHGNGDIRIDYRL